MFCSRCGKSVSAPISHSNQSNNTYKGTGKGADIQFFIRIILPFIIVLGFAIGAFATEEWIMLIIACIPLFIMFAGIKAAGRRCPQCGAWSSMVTIKSDCIGQQKVKVRRELGSGYFRTSGNNTFGIRQVFVSADEYVYNEIYRCNVCGHETRGTRRQIDDGIR